MFRSSRVLLSALQPHRVTTGITGLAVHPAPLPHLLQTYKSTLSIVSQLPKESVYRQATQALLEQRTKLVASANEDVAKVEKEIDEGMIEQVIEMAEDELKLAGKMLEWQAHEPLQIKPSADQWEPIGPELGQAFGGPH
ncbi:hypothetical protein FFLO_04022 [Filobasidium floriforme]|uniref:NADH2 dehydrogenase n=1 Tax=Filobasidium floriforme TaxID=5210 RepID=A0A8K0JJZ4_9TREE|nr:NADH2 dehydrogenase [Filobasidium floriforme]KAG7531876.1 hypothetical protein FFLO_04022 [Filobasidium floriforme]KAH8089134.1 NADH2 dehydrogenase [Filobasidium floriforme]